MKRIATAAAGLVGLLACTLPAHATCASEGLDGTQLALNAQVEAADVARLMDALAVRIAPEGGAPYVHGEADRLARAVYFAYRRGDVDTRFWNVWFARMSAPAPLASWNDAFRSESGLALRHNATAFALSLHFLAASDSGAAAAEVKARATAAMQRILRGGP